MTKQQMIDSAKNMVDGTNFEVVVKFSEFVDERGFPRRIKFNAVQFVNNQGKMCFIGELFL
jgi:hypothetical protein